MHTFTFNGKSTEDFNVRVSGEATWGKPAPIYERVTVPGRNGEIVIHTGAYENVPIQYRCGIVKDFDENYAAFVNYLLSSKGYLKLQDTYHPEYYRLAMVESIDAPSMERRYKAGEFAVTFSCKPQTYLASGDTPITVTSAYSSTTTKSITNPTLFDAKPLIRVYGTGVFGIAGSTITITSANSYTDIDCETQNAYKDTGATNCNGNIQLSGDAFPTFPAGTHSITLYSGITQVIFTPRWWQL